jgi:hypothetical protein
MSLIELNNERSYQMKSILKIGLVAGVLSTSCMGTSVYAENPVVDLSASEAGVEVLKNYSGEPNNQGIFEKYTLKLPAYKAGLLYAPAAWPRSSGRLTVRNFDSTSQNLVGTSTGGMLLVLQLENGRYMALLPLASELAYSWLEGHGTTLQLNMGTHGKDPLQGDIPLYVYTTGASPYEAVELAWERAFEVPGIKGNARLREDKEYFEQLKYPGWMSWGEFRAGINEGKMLAKIKEADVSEFPLRWLIMDDGHYDFDSGQPRLERFPGGYKTMKDAYAENGNLKWLSPWYSFCIGKRMTAAPGKFPKEFNDTLRDVNGAMLPQENLEASIAWWEFVADIVQAEKCDSLKIDFHGFEICAASGWSAVTTPQANAPVDNSKAIGNPFRTGFLLNKGAEIVSRERNLPLFQCNWTSAAGLFTSYQSVVNRCTGDYYSPEQGGKHHSTKSFTHDGYKAALLTGSLVWPDHDEYDPEVALTRRIDSVRRAVSGGGMVVYNIPEKLHPEIGAVFYQDGEIIRPLAPGVLTTDSLFGNIRSNPILKARAPLSNQTAVFHIVNVDGPKSESGRTLKTRITLENYQNASGLMQPNPGQWPIPEEGLYAYDNFAGTGRVMDGEYPVSLEGFVDALIQVGPIQQGWSVIGRTDKYLSAATVEVIEVSEKRLKIKLLEAGPFAIYSANGPPKCNDVSFRDTGNGLYKADLPVAGKAMELTLKR